MNVFRKIRRPHPAFVFLAPSVLILLVFVLLPIGQSLWMSLHDWSFLEPQHQWIGLANYHELMTDPRFWNALRNMVFYSVAAVTGQIGFGLVVALALQQQTRGITWLRAAYFFPVISSLATMAIVWKFLLDPDIGFLTFWLTRLGLPPINWLQSTTWAMSAVIVVGIWKNLGFNMVILLAGLQGIPQMYYEAANIRWRKRLFLIF